MYSVACSPTGDTLTDLLNQVFLAPLSSVAGLLHRRYEESITSDILAMISQDSIKPTVKSALLSAQGCSNNIDLSRLLNRHTTPILPEIRLKQVLLVAH